ncbi:hypothetical protein ACFL5X_01100 [Candidatus Omnitrophota bacterium]
MASFFWKFTRSGHTSRDYASLIIDIHSSTLTITPEGRKAWTTNQSVLSSILLLLQDVELVNKAIGQRGGLDKPAYVRAINKCRYTTNLSYTEQRGIKNLIRGKAIMGRHGGTPLDWGFCDDPSQANIPLDLSTFNPVIEIDAATGTHSRYKGEDLLLCYRKHPKFQTTGYYWDFMPKHDHIVDIFTTIKNVNSSEAERFVEQVLLWKRL